MKETNFHLYSIPPFNMAILTPKKIQSQYAARVAVKPQWFESKPATLCGDAECTRDLPQWENVSFVVSLPDTLAQCKWDEEDSA